MKTGHKGFVAAIATYFQAHWRLRGCPAGTREIHLGLAVAEQVDVSRLRAVVANDGAQAVRASPQGVVSEGYQTRLAMSDLYGKASAIDCTVTVLLPA